MDQQAVICLVYLHDNRNVVVCKNSRSELGPSISLAFVSASRMNDEGLGPQLVYSTHSHRKKVAKRAIVGVPPHLDPKMNSGRLEKIFRLTFV